MEDLNQEQQPDNPSPAEERHEPNRFMSLVRSLSAFLILLAVVVASFWVSFQLGKRLFVPHRGPERKIEVEIPAPPPALQELQKEMSKEAQALLPAPTREVHAVPKRTVCKKAAKPTKACQPKVAQGTHYFKVQAGVFKNKASAQALAERIEAAGFSTYVKKVASGWRTQVGAFRIKKQAQALQKKLAGKGFKSIVIYE